MPGKKGKLNTTSHKMSKKQNLSGEKRLWMHGWQYMGVQSSTKALS